MLCGILEKKKREKEERSCSCVQERAREKL
jgi:hypothetical protein